MRSWMEASVVPRAHADKLRVGWVVERTVADGAIPWPRPGSGFRDAALAVDHPDARSLDGDSSRAAVDQHGREAR